VFVFITHEAAGALGTRHSLRPLFSEARTVLAKPRAISAAGMRRRIPKLARQDKAPRAMIFFRRSGISHCPENALWCGPASPSARLGLSINIKGLR
jgi:hypothetical protein